MFALIKRELDDLSYLLVILVPLMLIPVIYNIYQVYAWHWEIDNISIQEYIFAAFIITIFLPLIMLEIGVSQMHFDRNGKISTFLICLAATRHRIFIAKLSAAVFVIISAVAIMVLLQVLLLLVFPKPLPIVTGLLARVHILTILLSLSCYSLGLLMGNLQRIWVMFLALIPAAILAAVIIIKGVGWQSWIILALFTTAAVSCTWQKFLKTPL